MNFRRIFPVFAVGFALAQSAAAQSEQTRYVWTGVTLDANGARFGPTPVVTDVATTYGDGTPVRTRVNPRATADAHLQALAELELAFELDRDVAAAQRALDELWARAASRTEYHGRFEVLEELALVRARLAERRGAAEDAHAALAQLLPGEALAHALAARFEFEPASDALVAEESRVLASPAYAQKAATGGGGKDEHPWEKGVEATVRAHFGNGTDEILSLGALAAPALEKILLEAPDSIFRADFDPLGLLVRVARARAGTFLRANVNAGGFLWHQRILRALDSPAVLGSEKIWTFRSTDLPPTLAEPVWSEIVDVLCDDPDARLELVSALRWFVGNDALTPKMQTTLLAALTGTNGIDAQSAAAARFDNPAGQATVRPVAEQALRSPVAAARRAGARWLWNDERSDVLIAAATDTDATVRAYVASAFGARKLERAEYKPGGLAGTRGNYYTPPLGARERALIEQLATDENLSVRRTIAYVVSAASPPFATELYVRLADDADWEVSSMVASNLRFDHPALAEVLGHFSRRATPETFAIVMRRLIDVCTRNNVRDDEFFAPFLPTLLRRLDHAEIPQTENVARADMTEVFAAAARCKGGIVGITQRLVAATENTFFSYWDDCLVLRQDGHTATVDPAIANLDDRLMEQAFRRFFALDERNANQLAQLLQLAAKSGVVHMAAWKSILSDERADVSLRVLAGAIAAPQADDDYDQRLNALLEQALRVDRRLEEPLHLLGAGFRADRVETFGLRLIHEPRIASETTGAVFGGLFRQANHSTWAKPALSRWIDTPSRSVTTILSNALDSLPTSDDDETVAFLRKALRVPQLWAEAINALSRMKQPIYLDLLVEEFDPARVPPSTSAEGRQAVVAAAIASYLSEDAAERLLRGVPLAVNEEVRAKMLASLEQVRAYLDAKRRWNARASDADKRAEAVSSLVKLCEDPDPATRAQAAKGLAALDALEQLPKLIALLKDKSPEVRAAAQQALDLLNAHAAAPATPPK